LGRVSPPGPPPAPATESDTATATAPKGPGCEGRADGWVCSEKVLNTALRCRNGNVEGGAYCDDPRKACKKAADDDFTATVVNGKVDCE
jgi:hypothetical protein